MNLSLNQTGIPSSSVLDSLLDAPCPVPNLSRSQGIPTPHEGHVPLDDDAPCGRGDCRFLKRSTDDR